MLRPGSMGWPCWPARTRSTPTCPWCSIEAVADAVDRHGRLAVGGCRLSDRLARGGRFGGRGPAAVGWSAAGSRICACCGGRSSGPTASTTSSGPRPAMRKVFETIEQVADSDVDVLVHGETGTGKELIARSIHRRSRRAPRAPSCRSIAGPFPKACWKANSSATRRGRSPGPTAGGSACWSSPITARFFSTSWANCRWSCRPSCCGRCKSGRFAAWAGTTRSASTSASSPPRPACSTK